jgi:hypothetical protein
MIPTVFKEATTIATNKKIAENTIKFVKNHGEKQLLPSFIEMTHFSCKK